MATLGEEYFKFFDSDCYDVNDYWMFGKSTILRKKDKNTIRTEPLSTAYGNAEIKCVPNTRYLWKFKIQDTGSKKNPFIIGITSNHKKGNDGNFAVDKSHPNYAVDVRYGQTWCNGEQSEFGGEGLTAYRGEELRMIMECNADGDAIISWAVHGIMMCAFEVDKTLKYRMAVCCQYKEQEIWLRSYRTQKMDEEMKEESDEMPANMEDLDVVAILFKEVDMLKGALKNKEAEADKLRKENSNLQYIQSVKSEKIAAYEEDIKSLKDEAQKAKQNEDDLKKQIQSMAQSSKDNQIKELQAALEEKEKVNQSNEQQKETKQVMEPKYKVMQKKNREYNEETSSGKIEIAAQPIIKGITAAVTACASGGALAPVLLNGIKDMVLTMSWSTSSEKQTRAEHFFDQKNNSYLFVEIEKAIEKKGGGLGFAFVRKVKVKATVKLLYAEAANTACADLLQKKAMAQAQEAFAYIDISNAGAWNVNDDNKEDEK